ncbi:Fur family transcriptional regulator [Agromyces aerolatus]|uniref:Fur family transcriptional regulator n=1 Tax=Agromyces sp. LY-1074 TaxID=3074080 RepID=UPI00285E6616|nr:MULTISPECIES: Fur family transcriptional regulator [unclassified Agromyces]MDR5699409.1 Fur family transcriptional regulator [Agromyces sp. LY-1074]MDR5705705.1 Fur family transcriptional regulator [Agromyces sp. LY-1358]
MPLDSGAQEHARLHASAGEATVDAAIRALRERGERVTGPRRAVLTVLAEHADHLTAEEVAALLEPRGVHRATVYRTLDLLAGSGVVAHRHAAGGATRYHLAAMATGQEHLHGHCLRCDGVIVLPVDAFDQAVAALHATTGFRLDAEQSTFSGVCGDCAAG